MKLLTRLRNYFKAELRCLDCDRTHLDEGRGGEERCPHCGSGYLVQELT